MSILNDECTRVARNLKLKLKPDNRIIPVLKYYLDNQIHEEIIHKILIELFSYDNLEDGDSQEMQAYLKQYGINKTINYFSELVTKINND